MQIVDWAKKHPVATATVVFVGGLLFVLIIRGGGSSSGTASAAGPSADAQLASETQLQMAQISAGAAASQTAASLSAAQLAKESKDLETVSAKEVALNSIAAQQATDALSIAANLQATAMEVDVSKTNINAQLAALTAGYNRDLGLANINSQTMTNVAAYQAQQAAIQAQSQIDTANIYANSQATLAQINANQDSHMAQIQADADAEQSAYGLQYAQIQAGVQSSQIKAQSKSSTLGSIAGIASTALMFLSDRRSKENMRQVEPANDLAPAVYAWSYGDSKRVNFGPMAQDMLEYAPEYVGSEGGLLALDYSGRAA